jgi:hypothetical protein
MRRVYAVLLTSISVAVQAQDVTGIWRGHFRSNDVYQRLTMDDDRYKMEVQIAQQQKDFQAVTYSYKSSVFYGKAVADGYVNFKTQKVLLREQRIEELKMSFGDACIMTCNLQYSKLGDEEFLEGTYTSRNTRDSSDCGKGTIFLHKVPTSDFYEEPFLLKKEKSMEEEKKNPPAAVPAPSGKSTVHSTPMKKAPSPSSAGKTTAHGVAVTSAASTKTSTTKTPNKPGSSTQATVSTKAPKPKSHAPASNKKMVKIDPNKHALEPIHKDSATIRIDTKGIPVTMPAVLVERSNEVVRTIEVNTRDVELNIYDDGAIDNDTVSVYFDNKLVVSRAMLTDRAIVVKLHLDDNQAMHKVVMVADNLGDIPPNTSLMVVKSGEKQYEVRIVSDEQKNAVVVFKYQKAP